MGGVGILPHLHRAISPKHCWPGPAYRQHLHLSHPVLRCRPPLWRDGPATAVRGARLRCRAQFTVKEQSTGAEFPEVTSFWTGTERFRSLGAGVRAKRFAFVPVKVYAVTLYVEADRAAKELGIRSRGGFFAEGSTSDDFALALSDGAFAKVLQVQLVRKVEGLQFYQAFDEALSPRMRLTGDTGSLQQFGLFFQDKSLEKGTSIVMLWRVEGILEVHLGAPGAQDFSKVSPDLRIESPALCRALFEVYLGDNSVVPDAKAAWAQGARALLATEQSKRGTDKAGAG